VRRAIDHSGCLRRASRFRPADEIVHDVGRARQRLIAAVAALPETRLGQRPWFTGPRTVGEALAKLVEHAREHRPGAVAELVAL
jgi:DinB family protein